MKYRFDTSQHLHAGYYENGYDIESILYKVLDRDAWVMYVDFNLVAGKFPKSVESQIDPSIGLDVLCVLEEAVDYATVAILFEEWLIAMSIV